MDLRLIEKMKIEAEDSFQFWAEVRENSPQNTLSPHATVALTGAIQAYAELCQAETLDQIAYQLTEGGGFSRMSDAELREIMGNRTDQSIADALSE